MSHPLSKNIPTNIDISTSSFLVTKTLFAFEVGVSLEVVEGWIKRGYLPTEKIGRFVLINKGKLWLQTIEEFQDETVPVSDPMASSGGRECKSIRRGSAHSVDTSNLLS